VRLALIRRHAPDIEQHLANGCRPTGSTNTAVINSNTAIIGPTGGSATVNHFVLGKQDTDIRRTVGVLTETPGMYDNLSAEYNMQIFAELYEVQDVKGQVEKYLRMGVVVEE